MLSAAELHRRGLEKSNAGRHAAARALFRQALPRADDPDVVARIRLSLAHVEAELGTADQGFTLCREVLDGPKVSPQVLGRAHSQLALLHMRAGSGEEALAEFGTAIQLLGPEREALATAFVNRGNVYLQRGDMGRATADLELAVEYTPPDEPELRAKAEHNLGYARLLAGDLAGALAAMEAARPTLAVLSPVYEAVCEQDRAEVLIAAGMTADAETSLRAAARAYGVRRLRQRQAEAELVLARLLLLNEPRESAKVARRAKRRFTLRGSEVWALRADGVAVVAELEAGTNGPEQVTRCVVLADALREHGLVSEATGLELQVARAVLRAGDVTAARDRLAGFRPRTTTPLATRLLHREVRAELAYSRRRRSAGLRQVRAGLAELHSWQSSFGSLDLQSSLVGHGRRLALMGLGAALADGRPELVFEWAERARALASRVAPVRPPADPDAAGDLAELRQLQADRHAVGATASAARDKRESELRVRIRQHAWYDEGSHLVREPVSLRHASDELAASDGALVAYVVHGGLVHALVVAGSRASVVELGEFTSIRSLLPGMQADLDMAAAHLSPMMRAGVQASLGGRLVALADRLVSPLRPLFGDRRLVVVPAGALAGVPWSLLPGFVARPLTVPRSASSWVRTRPDTATIRTAGFVAGPRVERAEEEVSKAGGAWADSRMLFGSAATCDEVSGLAAMVDLLHVSAHGRHSADNPLFSGLELVDGPWFGYDIDRLASIPATVVLSACELGRSSVRWGEESIGMTAAWLHAGTRCVIASPASVDDDVACEVLATTHDRLASGDRPADALAAAVAGHTGSGVSPFICFGTGW